MPYKTKIGRENFMNYTRGCYRRPTLCNMQRSAPPFNHQMMGGCCSEKEQYDVAQTAEMNYKLAMVYSPYQEWQNIYNGEKALENGTIFAELDKPFMGYKCNRGICTL